MASQTSSAHAPHVCALPRARVPTSLRTCGTPVGLVLRPCSRTAARYVRAVARDGALFGAVPVKLPGEEDEVSVQCVQVPAQLRGQRVPEGGRADVRQRVARVLADLLRQGRKGLR